MRWLTVCLVLLFGCLAGAETARAQDYIVERAWLEDATNQMSWAQAQQHPTQQFSGTLNRGFGTAAVWIRLHIDPHVVQTQSSPKDELVLRMRPVYLDEIVVFDPLAAGGKAGVLGDRHHPRLDAMPGSDFLLAVPKGDAPREIWLRLASTSTRQIHVVALSPGALATEAMRWNIVTSLYIGVALILLIWAIIHRVLHREKLMSSFALAQLSAVLFGLSSLGVLRAYWPLAWSAETLDLLGSVFSVLVVSSGILFHVLFLREFRPAGWAMGLLYAVLALVAVNLVLLALGQVRWALQGNMVSILLAPPICLLCTLTGRAWGVTADDVAAPALSRRVLVSFYVVFLVIFVLSASTGLGLVRATEWTLYVSQLHTLVSSVLLILMLEYRAFVLGQRRQQAQLLFERTTLQMAHEREMREEQEKLLAMLAHEIKTPLATMHLRLDGQSKGGREIRQAMRDMNGVIDRCLQTLQMGDGQLVPQMQWHDLAGSVWSAVSASSQPGRMQVHLPPLVRMETDPQLLFIVLSNLLENACKYSEPESPIELRCSVVETPPEKPVARLELSNLPGKTGWPDPQQIFDKYYRAPLAKRKSGTGLGLYLVKSLTQTLGGHIAYQPDGAVARFVLTLPLNATK
jgi:signal transduction histidine kinase